MREVFHGSLGGSLGRNDYFLKGSQNTSAVRKSESTTSVNVSVTTEQLYTNTLYVHITQTVLVRCKELCSLIFKCAISGWRED